MNTLQKLLIHFICILFCSVSSAQSDIDVTENHICVVGDLGSIEILISDAFISQYPLPYEVEVENLDNGEILDFSITNNSDLVTNLESGNYLLIVDLDDICSYEEEFEILVSNISLGVNSTNASLPYCNNGMINVSINDGIPPYDVEWYTQGNLFYSISGITGNNDGEDIINLEGDQLVGIEYTVVVTDACGSSVERSVLIGCSCERCELYATNIVQPSCNSLGSFTLD